MCIRDSPNYNRILLSPVLAGEMTLQDIVLNDFDWYRQHGITLHAGKTVTEIDRIHRVVTADDGTTAEYDRLLDVYKRQLDGRGAFFFFLSGLVWRWQ